MTIWWILVALIALVFVVGGIEGYFKGDKHV
jgi:uncharacterized membrane protein